jgi:starch synthase
LADTIEDGATGFLFDGYDARALRGTLERALRVFADPPRWRALMRRAMTRDFGWETAVSRYRAVYTAVVASRGGQRVRAPRVRARRAAPRAVVAPPVH